MMSLLFIIQKVFQTLTGYKENIVSDFERSGEKSFSGI